MLILRHCRMALLFFAAALSGMLILACGGAGRMVSATVDSISLRANTVGLSSRQPVRIYLPPSYTRSQRRYPVLYFLPGFDDLCFAKTLADPHFAVPGRAPPFAPTLSTRNPTLRRAPASGQGFIN